LETITFLSLHSRSTGEASKLATAVCTRNCSEEGALVKGTWGAVAGRKVGKWEI